MSEVIVKVTFREETRRIVVNLVEGEDPVEYVKSKCSEYFNLKNVEKFNLNYTDADGDEVTLTNATELKNLIKLRLVKRGGATAVKVEPKKEFVVVSENIEETPMESAPSFDAPAVSSNWFGEFKKKKFEKENIVEIKAVKLAWKVGDETGYLVAKHNGKLAFKRRAKGLRGVWFLKKSDKGDIFCAPATAPKRHLRMMPQTFEINLNDGEMGPWSRWSFAPVGASENEININSLEDLAKSDVNVHFTSGCHDGNIIAIKLIEKQKKNTLHNKQKKVLVGTPSNEESAGSISIESKVNLDFLLFRFSKKFHKMGMGFGCRKFWRKKCWAKRFGMNKFGGHPGFGPGPFGPHGGFGHHGPHGGFGFGHHGPFGHHHGPHGGFGHHGPHGGPGFGHHGPHGGFGFGHHGPHGGPGHHHGPHGRFGHHGPFGGFGHHHGGHHFQQENESN